MTEMKKMGSLSTSFPFKNITDKANFSDFINGQEPLQPRKNFQSHAISENVFFSSENSP